jgi:hypothetical protein
MVVGNQQYRPTPKSLIVKLMVYARQVLTNGTIGIECNSGSGLHRWPQISSYMLGLLVELSGIEPLASSLRKR